MYKRILILMLPLFLAFSCNNSTENTNRKSDKSNANISAKRENSKPEEITRYRPLPKHIYDQIYKYADYLDVIFEDLDFSMSQDNNASIRSFLSNINLRRTPAVKSSCKPMGHVVFLKKGNPIIEADFFHSPGCYYFLFYDEKGKPLFANSMTDMGIRFFDDLKNGRYKPAK